jgi:hypothetical protein
MVFPLCSTTLAIPLSLNSVHCVWGVPMRIARDFFPRRRASLVPTGAGA